MPDIKELFRQSPFEPLRHHMNKVMECVGFVGPMFRAVLDADYDELDAVAKRVFKVEHEADIIKDEIRQTIPTRFFLPVYRGDLLGYLKLQDDMADAVEDVAALLSMKKLAIPADLTDLVREYVAKVEEVCAGTLRISDELPKLVEADMGGAAVKHVLKMVAELEHAEWEADRIQHTLSKGLFAHDDEMKPTDVLLWFRIFGELGQLANFAEKTGDRLRRMLAS